MVEVKHLDNLDESERARIGKILVNMTDEYRELLEILFVFDVDDEIVAEKIYNASDLMSIFRLYMKGEDLETIGESIFQTDEESIVEILGSLGILN